MGSSTPTLKKRYVETPSGQLHVQTLAARAPNGESPLILLHPSPFSGVYFDTVMPALNATRDDVAPDYPGYGGSYRLGSAPTIALYADAMAAVIDAVAPDRPVDVLGFHTGCLVGAELCLGRPERVRRLILCDVPYFSAEMRAKLLANDAEPLPISTELVSIDKAWQFNIAKRAGQVPLPRLFTLLVEHLRAGDQDNYGFVAAFSYDCQAQFARLKTPTTLIATDSYLAAGTREAAADIAGARLIDAADVKAPVFEAPVDAIAKILLDTATMSS